MCCGRNPNKSKKVPPRVHPQPTPANKTAQEEILKKLKEQKK